MAVRNFWLDADVDGRKTPLTGGPQSKDGGMRLTIYQRDRGGIITAATVNAFVDVEGDLVLRVGDGAAGEVVLERKTAR